MENRNDYYVLWFGLQRYVVFDYRKFVIELPEASASELELIQSSNLYQYFENDLTAAYCELFGIDVTVLNVTC